MWNEFEYVEDGRFDPNRDGEHGEYRDENYNYNFDEDDEDGEDDSDDDSFDVEPEEEVDMFRKMYPMVSGILDKGRKDLYYNTEGK